MARVKQITRWRNKEKRKNEILKYIKVNSTVVAFDVETTGLGDDAKIIQFSAIKYKVMPSYEFVKIDDLDVYINPNEPLSKKIVEITGITDIILALAADETYWCPKIFEFLNDADCLIGYNVRFDIKMLNQMASRTGNFYEELPYIDVMEMARDWLFKDTLEKHTLSSVTEYLHPEKMFQFHSSIEDVKATMVIFKDFIGMYEEYTDSQKEKDVAHLERAHLFINQRKPSEQRIKLVLNRGEDGDIFWDIRNQEWGCCMKTSAKQLFNSINLTNLEEQFMEKYGYKFDCNLPKYVAKKWMDYRKEKMKEKE